MKAGVQPRACDQDRLEAFLRGDLAASDESQLLIHLERCDACRQALEQQAAGPEAWEEAKRLLTSREIQTQPVARPPLEVQAVVDALAPTDDPAMLGRLGGYEIAGVVGAGGMGVVLKALDRSLDRTVAIKVLAPHLAASGAARKRFAREAKAAAAVLHPNVIAIHGVASDEPLPYLVMPYLRGHSLQKRLDDEGPLAVQEILRIGSQIAAGLAAAHAQGLVHRDIKPANILLEEGVERVAITDFGLARAADDAALTRTGSLAGTPQYMSPEQARGEAVDARSDLFSLGSVLYAMCTGRPPFRAETSYGVLRRITDDEPPPPRELNPEIPPWLCKIVSRLMAKRATDRCQSAAGVAELLAACLAHVQQPTAVPLPASLAAARTRGRLLPFSPQQGVIAMLTVVGSIVLAAVVWQGAGNPASPESATNKANAPQPPAGAKAANDVGGGDGNTQGPAMPKRIHQFKTNQPVHRIAISLNGQRIAVANGNPTFIRVTSGVSRLKDNWLPWTEIREAATGKTLHTLDLSSAEEDAVLAGTERVIHFEVTALEYSPAGDVLAVGTSIGQVKLFSTKTGELVRTLDDEQARLADKETPENWQPMKRALGSVRGLAFSPDGKLLAVCGESFADFSNVFDGIDNLGLPVSGPGRLKVWDVASGKLMHDLPGHSDASDVAVSPDGSMLTSVGRWAGADHGAGAITWNPQSGKKLSVVQIEANGGAVAVSTSPTRKMAAIASRIFDNENGTSSTAISMVYPATGLTLWQRTFPGWASPRAFSPDGKALLVLAGGQSIRLIDAESGGDRGELKADLPEGSRWQDFAVAPSARRLVVGSASADKDSGTIEVWEFEGLSAMK